MNPGRGFPNPQQNGVDSWNQLTPQKPIVSRSNLLQAGMEMQGRSNWQDLLGMYSGLLQGQANTNGVFQQELQNNNGVFQDFNSSGIMSSSPGGHNTRNFAVTDNRGSFNLDAGSYRQSLGDNNPVWYRNSSLPELPGFSNNNASYEPSSNGAFHMPASNSNGAFYTPSPNGAFYAPPPPVATPDRNRYISSKPYVSSSLSLLERSGTGYGSASSILPVQNSVISSTNPRSSEYNLLQPHKDGFPVPYQPIYNLNSSTPRPEGGIASSAPCRFRFAPVTPDQGKQLKNQQLSGISTFLIDEGPSQRKDKQEDLVVSIQHQNVQRNNNELQNLVDSSSIDVTASLKENQVTLDGEENQVTLDGDHGGIDLNETPKQKTPRRRKHRPKVVIEGKPKRTPKPKTPKNNTPIENPAGKRKYVRRKVLNASATQQGNATDEIRTPDGSETKSCRRALNFDLENPAEDENQDKIDGNQAKKHENSKEHFNLNLNFQDPECNEEINRKIQTSASYEVKQPGYTAEVQRPGTMVTLTPPKNKMPAASSSSSLIPAAAAAANTANNRTLNVIARNLSMRSANLYQTGNQNGHSQGHQDILGHSVIQANATRATIDRSRQLLQQSPQVMKDATGAYEQRGSKRSYYQTSVLPHAQTNTWNGSRLLGIYTADGHYVDSSNLGVGASETFKKMKVLDLSTKPTNSLLSCVPATASSSRQMETRIVNGLYTSSPTSHIKGNRPDYNLEKESSSRKLIRSAYQIPGNQHINTVAGRYDILERHASPQAHLLKEQTANETSQPKSQVHNHNSLAIVNWNMPSPIDIASRSTQGHEIETSYTNVSTKKQRQGLAKSKKPLSRDRLLSDDQNCSTTTGAASQGKKKCFDLIDHVIDKLSGLHISNNGKDKMGRGQTAIVPYKADGSIVPYNEVDSIKRRRPRPKVDLDPESNRLWNLLMGKEGTENVDKHTEKWWEEERNVFRGRIDSFIARMHLVQGDRRFSPWKGSVVDSVIGVFLTQNVSDHLSSSAFMSLAAKFPLAPSKQACWWNEANPIVEEPEVQIIDPDGTITYHARIARQPVYYQSSTTSSETSEQRPENPTPGTSAPSQKKNKRVEDEVISSQTSPDSIIYQAIEEARSASGFNSEREDRISLRNFHENQTSDIVFLQRERTAVFQEYQSNVTPSSFTGVKPDIMYQQPDHLTGNSFVQSTSYGQNLQLDRGCDTYAYPKKLNMTDPKGCPPSSNLWSNLGQASIEIQPAFQDKHPEPKFNHRFVKNNQEKSSTTTQLVNTYSAETVRPEALPKSQTGETSTSNKPASETGTGISNVKKRKLESEKTKAFDWDSLRKQVHSEGGRKERSKDKMDSLDYEALRHADVKMISDTIKERGMNNMLAERIKDFLNRLVEEHERIDLEWLREVPPDKVKDYLLSIRGLGLKSVECVRLLTLHNVAFPVDTNVGRIAVRLGWVPLQPLPESLQLHLLELYPVLESIQKYLWPRLCKLDQRTLYELHYQMITFGKVFCTKSKPNCNACPMRGECRHFASAFASARLALPGPEERGIVSSTAPIAVQEIPAETFFKPMALLPPANTNPVRGTGSSTYSREPIVHEPTTPELSTEVTESDIEDAFYNDDSDEIPTIKLNIEEFTTNLQSYMQENMELQEGDLSKAIVALNPEVASIPTAKLKNVSRLRTEHQVYELPDSHPLLKGLDRREPDDPSPYLLAIWTPGETANSIQIPESKCDYQGLGRLCNENTCFSCNSIREANSQTVRGTILIPCRTAMRGSFPLNGTYFQVNEVFADHKSSLDPIDVPRAYIWNLPRRTVYFGTSVTSIFKGLTTEGIQFCFWRGFVCVRGFDQETRAPRPLMARLHFPASKMVKTKNEENKKKATLPKEEQAEKPVHSREYKDRSVG